MVRSMEGSSAKSEPTESQPAARRNVSRAICVLQYLPKRSAASYQLAATILRKHCTLPVWPRHPSSFLQLRPRLVTVRGYFTTIWQRPRMSSDNPLSTSFGKWMALTAALLGWLFDGLEMGLFPLVAGPALVELGVSEGDVVKWNGVITALFLVGAATGGVLFGWLGDRIGRVRSMMLSVLTYAIVSGLCGFATEAWQIGALRFVAALGMGGEWSLGVALINELWPDRSRAFLAGLIGAAANVGYLFSALVGFGLSRFFEQIRGGL